MTEAVRGRISSANRVSHMVIQGVLMDLAALESQYAELETRLADVRAEREVYRELAQAALTTVADLSRKVERLTTVVREQHEYATRYTRDQALSPECAA